MKPYELIETTGWTQGCSARDALGNNVCTDDTSAVAFCAYGSVCRAALIANPMDPADIEEAVGALNSSAQVALGGSLFTPVAWYNDKPGRTKEEVLAFMRDTAAKLRAAEAVVV